MKRWKDVVVLEEWMRVLCWREVEVEVEVEAEGGCGWRGRWDVFKVECQRRRRRGHERIGSLLTVAFCTCVCRDGGAVQCSAGAVVNDCRHTGREEMHFWHHTAVRGEASRGQTPKWRACPPFLQYGCAKTSHVRSGMSTSICVCALHLVIPIFRLH